MKSLILIFLSQFMFINSIQSAAAEEITLVVPGIVAIHDGIKITTDNMAVRKFEKSVLPGRYLTPEEFESVINKTVSEPIKPGFPVPYESIIPLWKPFTSDEGAFTVIMPGTPAIDTYEDKVETGSRVNSHSFLVHQGDDHLKQGFHIYMIHYLDYPPDVFPDPGKNNITMHNRDVLVKTFQADDTTIKQLDETELMLDGHAGLQINAILDNAGQEMYIFHHLYQVKNRQYFLRVLSDKEPAPAEDRAKFFQSFKLLNP